MGRGLGVEYIEFANIQYYNWALLNRDELMPSLEQIREAEAMVNRWRAKLGKRMTIYFVIPDYYEGRPKACMNGWGAIHLTIAPDGVAMPCQESRVIPGLEFESVREQSLGWIWHESPLFRKYRGLDWLPEPCQSCSEKEKDFGGCRCQAFLLTGDAGNTDPACSRSPHHHRVTEAVTEVVQPLRFRKPLVKRGERACPPPSWRNDAPSLRHRHRHHRARRPADRAADRCRAAARRLSRAMDMASFVDLDWLRWSALSRRA